MDSLPWPARFKAETGNCVTGKLKIEPRGSVYRENRDSKL